MVRSATDVMQEIIFSALLDSLAALKAASKGVPNTLLRDLNALHANATFADLPKELKATIAASTRSAFTRLQKEGYSVSSASAVASGNERKRQPRPAAPGSRPPKSGAKGSRGPRAPIRKG